MASTFSKLDDDALGVILGFVGPHGMWDAGCVDRVDEKELVAAQATLHRLALVQQAGLNGRDHAR